MAWTSALIHALVHASVLLLPTVLVDLQRAFGASLLAVLGAANIMYLLFGLAAVPAGYLADRLGSRTLLLLASGGCAVALGLIAAAPSFAVLTVGLALLGLSAGIYHPSGLSLLSRRVGSHERGRVLGIHGVGGNLGEALAPAWSALFATRLGWRWGFGSAALLAVTAGALALTLPADLVPRAQRRPVTSWRAQLRDARATLRGLWGRPPLRWLIAATVAGGLVYRGVLTFLPMHLAGSSGGPFAASYLTSFVLIAGIAAQRFGGELADRLPRERLFLAEVALFAPVLVLLGLTSGLGLVACALSFGFLWYMAQPLGAALAAAYADAQDHGLLYGIQFAATFGIGSFATTLGGLFAARGGTGAAFVGFGAIAMLQLAAAWALVRSVPRAPSRSAVASEGA